MQRHVNPNVTVLNTLAASALQVRKLIRNSRGHLHRLDRRGLEPASCRFYRIIKNLRF